MNTKTWCIEYVDEIKLQHANLFYWNVQNIIKIWKIVVCVAVYTFKSRSIYIYKIVSNIICINLLYFLSIKISIYLYFSWISIRNNASSISNKRFIKISMICFIYIPVTGYVNPMYICCKEKMYKHQLCIIGNLGIPKKTLIGCAVF